MKEPDPQQLLEQLAALENWCREYRQSNSRNSGSYTNNLTNIYKPLRDGIVFYSNGWGWRLRNHWQDNINQKRQELVEQIADHGRAPHESS